MAVESECATSVFRAEVRSVRPLTAGMIRVVFGGMDLSGFSSTGVGDEYVRVFFPAAGQGEPVLPTLHGSTWTFSDGTVPSERRTYTIRGFDRHRHELVIDFVVHTGGVAAAWARRARPGDVVVMNGPTGLYQPPPEMRWQLLFADATGLPAASRIIEQTPDSVLTRAVFEVASPSHVQTVAAVGKADVTWIYGGNGHGPSRLDQAVRTAEMPSGSGYVWAAGEVATLRAVRRYLRHELGLPASAYKAIGYWNFAAEDYRERLSALDVATVDWLEAAFESGVDEEEQMDEYIARLETLGL